MSDDGDSGDEAPEDETLRGAPEPEELDHRAGDGEEEAEIPPGVKEEVEEEQYHDEYDEAREQENPDDHRDEEHRD